MKGKSKINENQKGGNQMKPNWTNRKKFLTKAEMKHLSVDAGCRTQAQFQNTINVQKKTRDADSDPRIEPCWDCRSIAKKLEMVGIC